MPKTTGDGAGNGAPFSLPADLTGQTVEQLAELRAAAQSRFDAIYDAEGGPTAADLEAATSLADALEAIGARESEIATEAADTAAKFDALRQRATPPAPVAEVVDAEIVDAPADVALPAEGAPNPALVTAAGGRPAGGAVTASRELGGLAGATRSLNPSLSGARTLAPKQAAPQEDLAITASVGLPGKFEAGVKLTDRDQLVELIQQRAGRMPITRGDGVKRHHDDAYGGVQVASIANKYDSVFDETTGVDAIQKYMEKLEAERRPAQFEALVAAGGWCAPSENRYDFFNVACEGGMIDLPTFGVNRGGVNFPVSPSLADTFTPAIAPFGATFSNATVPWLWTETDDIATITGAPNKPCIRVPCAAMTNVRLECYGICLTAGNLADNAWPESTRNMIKLLMAAHYHASNARYISQMVALASTQVTGSGLSSAGVAAPLLGGAELQSWDYRTRYGMCTDDVLEYVLPAWSIGAVRSDLAKRTGVSDFMAVTDAQLAQWFDVRNIRVQFVQDYQVRSAGLPGAGSLNVWPNVVNGLMYAAGTVGRGNGMSLDLGIVRDSTLNAENDFTALWMEECHLIARFGHEIRNIQTLICSDGTTGAADLTTCAP